MWDGWETPRVQPGGVFNHELVYKAHCVTRFVLFAQIKTLEIVRNIQYDTSATGNEAVATKIVLIDERKEHDNAQREL
ncbi:MAG: hypothetical protein KatS3mg055_1477 [Chloroflexus sp.]|nr:MAG: hypothetical protein KatS3mg055_1477 [Chloroflexus sp.]